MGALSDTVKNSLLDGLCRNVAYQNAQIWAKLHTGAPGAAGANNASTESTRKQVTFGAGAASRTISNTALVEWTGVSTTETHTHVSLWSASVGGTFLGADALPASVASQAGENVRIAIGDIDLTIGGTDIADGIANSMLDAVCRNVAFQIAAVHIKLHLGDPGAAGTTNPAAHTTRVQATFGAGAAAAAISNTAAVSFTGLTAAETISHVSAWSSGAGGTFLFRKAASSNAAVGIGDTWELPIGDLDVTLSGAVP